jgi:uncharacterized protein (DUF1800 family)
MISRTLPALLLLTLPVAAAELDASALTDRLTWGQTANGDALNGLSPHAWLEQQLHPGADDGLPRTVQAQIDAMEISHTPITDLAAQASELQKEARQARKDGQDDAKAMRQPYREKLVSLAVQAQTRSLLRDIYSKNQLKEQLTWFWMNHFNVYARKREIAALVGDYEETAIRPHVLGHFRELLAATLFHPAMIQYLDNQQNAADKINENYAREIMELHTMGVGSGYTQKDVQELARVLTGVGVNLSGRPRAFARFARPGYTAAGLFEFAPRRHDFGDKVILGQTIKGRGLEEVAQAIDLLARQPATARHVSTQLAQYFCCDAPSPQLVDAMASTWSRTDGDIAEVLRTLFHSAEFSASLGHRFKDPVHYAVSAVRAVYGNQPITNALPIVLWTVRMGEPLYGHETPDGYALSDAAWSGPGQMATRFEIAKAIGAGAPQLFTIPDLDAIRPRLLAGNDMRPRRDDAMGDAAARAPVPVLEQTAYYQSLSLPAATKNAITQGATQADRNMLFLSSPDFMRR